MSTINSTFQTTAQGVAKKCIENNSIQPFIDNLTTSSQSESTRKLEHKVPNSRIDIKSQFKNEVIDALQNAINASGRFNSGLRGNNHVPLEPTAQSYRTINRIIEYTPLIVENTISIDRISLLLNKLKEIDIGQYIPKPWDG